MDARALRLLNQAQGQRTDLGEDSLKSHVHEQVIAIGHNLRIKRCVFVRVVKILPGPCTMLQMAER